MAQYQLTVNGKRSTVTVEPDTPLLYVLRNDLGLNGPKFGCGLAQCGACSVLVGRNEVRSCVVPVSRIAAKALLDRNPRPSEAQVREALNGHLCRCASHNRILRAVQKAAQAMRASAPVERTTDQTEAPV